MVAGLDQVDAPDEGGFFVDNCTIYSPVMAARRVVDIVKGYFGSDSISVNGSEVEWDSVSVIVGNSMLVLNSKVRKSTGDDFSRLIMSTHTYISKIPETEEKDTVLKSILSTKWMIGVVSEPGFEESPFYEECVFKICQELEAMVFNGQGMLSGEGDELLMP